MTSPNLSPAHIVKNLDQNIIGQAEAKRAVAVAFRNRWRRMQISDDVMRQEVTPKNILMVGPTGVGKTEIARRLAKLANAPFIKVEATKFTEVGYVGRDVESIIRDLVDIAYKLARERAENEHEDEAEEWAVNEIIESKGISDPAERTKMKLHIEGGKLDDETVNVQYIPPERSIGVNIAGLENMPHHLEELGESLRDLFKESNRPRKAPRKREMSIANALTYLKDFRLSEKINDDELRKQAVELVEQNGIVFIDEIDKIATDSSYKTADISRQGVQRDLLPLVEGTTVSTKFGQISTTHILFIASGSFHYSAPSDLIPELQGRLPVRVNLNSLTTEDFVNILSKTDYCLVKQYQALLATEGIDLQFNAAAIKKIAEIAQSVNERQENIGARRLHTIMEKLVEEISYQADTYTDKVYKFNAAFVEKTLAKISQDEEASRIFL